MRTLRSSLIEAIDSDYVEAARSRGYRESRVVGKLAMRNALVPLISVLSINIGFLISGTVIVEVVFQVPGLGALLVQSVLNRDYPVIQGLILVFGAMVILVNILADAAYAVSTRGCEPGWPPNEDPRLGGSPGRRSPGGGGGPAAPRPDGAALVERHPGGRDRRRGRALDRRVLRLSDRSRRPQCPGPHAAAAQSLREALDGYRSVRQGHLSPARSTPSGSTWWWCSSSRTCRWSSG